MTVLNWILAIACGIVSFLNFWYFFKFDPSIHEQGKPYSNLYAGCICLVGCLTQFLPLILK
jgi:hypothetical protein